MKTRLLLFAVMAWVLLAPLTARAQPLADRIPADALVYIGWTGADSMPPAFAASHLKAVLDASNAADLVNKLLPQLIDKIAEKQRGDPAMTRDITSLATALWKYPTAVYFGGMEFPQPVPPNLAAAPQPRLAIIAKTGAETAAIKTILDNLLKQAGRTPVKIAVLANVDTVFLVVGDLPQSALKRLGAPFEEEQKVAPTAALTDDANFKTALAKGHKDAVFIAYANVAGILKLADEGVQKAGDDEAKTNWPKVRDALGLPGIKQVLMSCGFEGQDWGSRLFIDAPAPRKGLLAMLDGPGAGGVSDKALELIPRNAGTAMAGRLDLAACFTQVRTIVADIDPRAGQQLDQGLKQVSAMIGLDVQKELLGALGEEWACYTDKGIAGNGMMGMVVVNRLKDAAAGEKAFAQLEKALSSLIDANVRDPDIHIRFKTTTVPAPGGEGAQTIHYLAVPLVAPAWTIKDGNLYLALYPQVLAAAIDRPQGESILQNPQFVQFRQNLGGGKASAITFTDLPQTASDGYQMTLMLAQLALGAADLFGLDAPAMTPAPLHKILPHLSPAGGACIVDETGWYFHSVEPFPGSSLLSGQYGMMGVQSVPLMMGVMVPALASAKQSANAMKSGTQVRGIVNAAILWSAANTTDDSLPPDLAAMVLAEKGDPLSPKLLFHPRSNLREPEGFSKWDHAKMQEWFEANSSYVYLGKGKKNNIDASMILVYEKPQFADKGTIAVGYGDCHVARVPVRQALAAIAKQEGGQAPAPGVGGGDQPNKTPPPPPR